MEPQEGIRPENTYKQTVLVKDLLNTFLKAKKNLRLYPPNNPIYIKTIDDAYKKMEELYSLIDFMELRIGRNEIFYGGEIVFLGAGKDDNLALIFFRDGIRELSFKKDMGRDELQGFLEILSVDFDSENVEDDIVTLLWEKDFPHIAYKVDDAVLMEDENYESVATEKVKESSMKEEGVSQAYADATESQEREEQNIVNISEEDFNQLAREVKNAEGDKKGKIIDILFDMFYLSETTEDLKELARLMNSMMDYSVKQGDIGSAITLIKRTKGIIDTANSEEARIRLGTVISFAGTSVIMNNVGQLLDRGTLHNEAQFNEFIGLLGANAIPSFISLLGELQTIAARRYVINGLVALGKKDINAVAKGLRDSRWYVVRNIVYILRMIGDVKAVENLIKMPKHNDVRVRKEVLYALGKLGGPGASQAIKEYLNDLDQSVRIGAIRSLGNTGSELAKKLILDAMTDKNLAGLEFEEMKAYFESLSRWNDNTVVGFLSEVLNRNPLIKRGMINEMKACAAYCLGLMGRKDYLEELRKLTSSKHKIISEYATAAVKRIEDGR